MRRHGLKRVSRRWGDALVRVEWDRLEALLADHYRAAGYRVEHVGTGASRQEFDGGIDLKLWKDDAYLLVQVKHWNAYKVPHNEVHQLIGLMVNQGASGAILVTSGEFTKAAIEAGARNGNVQLVDGEELRQMLGELPEAAPVPTTWGAGPRQALGRRSGDGWLEEAFAKELSRGGQKSQRSVASELGKAIVPELVLGLIKLVGMALVLVFVYKTFNGALKSAMPSSSQVQSEPRSVTQSIPRQIRQAPRADAPTVQSTQPQGYIRACRELIDAPSGTYMDHCTKARPPSAAGDAAGERKDAMEVLRATTPSM